jgi:ParB-like chromosome segregation protein Spo0J
VPALTPRAEVHPQPLDGLVPNPDNPRFILDERFADLKFSLEAEPEMMLARPLIVLGGPEHRAEREAVGWPDGVVIGGNMRLRAAQDLGWSEVPSIVVDLDVARARQWALRDNAPYGEWQADALAEMVYELSAAGTDMRLTGFSSRDVERIIASVAGDGAPDAFAEAGEETDFCCPSCGFEWSGSPRPVPHGGGEPSATTPRS